jgi:hypothetical protein
MVSNSEDTHDHFKIPMLAILPWQLGTQVKRAQLWSNNIHDKTIRCHKGTS